MNDLIRALQIIAKYNDKKRPTHCEHDVLYVPMDTDQVSSSDKVELEELGFIIDAEGFYSYRYGSC